MPQRPIAASAELPVSGAVSGGLLFVCAANRARSVWAELAARRLLDRIPGGVEVEVGSAGTWTRGGEPMWPPAAQEALFRGLEPAGVRSRLLTPQLAEASDVVLAATRAIRDDVVAAAPAVVDRAFTWRELDRLLAAAPPAWGDAAPVDRVRSLAAHGRRARGLVPALPDPAALDVDDPAGRSAETVRRCADETFVAVARIVAALTPSVPRGGDRSDRNPR